MGDISSRLGEKMTHLKQTSISVLLVLILVVTILISISLGQFHIDMETMFKTIFSVLQNDLPSDLIKYKTIIFNVRLPRIISAVFIGGALAVSGTSYQSMFKNPMVSPDILGVSTGAGFGAALGILFQRSYFEVQILAFIFGLLAVWLAYIISAAAGEGASRIVTLVLSGLVIRTVFQALISGVKYLADPTDALPEITFWLMGSLSSITVIDAITIGIPAFIGIFMLMGYRWSLNLMAFGDEEAASLGLNPIKVRRKVIVISTVIVSVSISVCGTIGWVGLIIPHLARMIVGPDNRIMLPVSALLGGIYLLLMDNLARNLMQVEIPISILTSIIGAPVFVLLLIRTRRYI